MAIAAPPRFLALYAALYAAFGAQSPFLPALLAERGLAAEAIGLALAAGTAVKLVAGPAAGRIADQRQAPQHVLALAMAAAALAGLAYLPARGLLPLLLASVFQAALLAPLAPLADALALGAAAPQATPRRLDYGFLRGAGSAAFILGSLAAGPAIGRFGLPVIVVLAGALLGVGALVAVRLRPLPRAAAAAPPARQRGDLRALLRLPHFRRLMLVAALILGSHALHDGFAVIRWSAAGIGPTTVGFLWSEAVAAEVVVFLVLGRPLLDRIGPAGAAALAAAAGVLRWAVMAETAWVPAVALVQPLHGLTFALLHLGAMRLMAAIVPEHLAATALALYGTLAIGGATALMTLAAGPLYARLGPHGFWVMAALSAAALPLAAGLRAPAARGTA